jgi:hypothetical protein
LVLAGLLIILILLFFQGKLDPLKRRVEIRLFQVETTARFIPAGMDFALR